MRCTSINIACSSSEDCRGETNILDLNDKCLKKLFGCLNESDLDLLASVCKRFKQITSALSIKNFQYIDMHKAGTHLPSLVEPSSTRLVAFNGTVREFDLVIEDPSITPPQETRENCQRELESSQSNSFTLDDGSVTQADPVQMTSKREKHTVQPTQVFTQYHHNRCLRLRNTEISEANFDRCNVHTLNLARVKFDAIFWNQHFPYLKSVTFKYMSVDAKLITNFFQRNHQLEIVDIFRCQGFDGSILASIGKYLPNIKSLDCCLNESNETFDRMHIPKLDQLSILHLGCNGIRMSSLVNKLFSHDNALTDMSLHGCTLDEECAESVLRLQELKHLTLGDCLELSNKKIVNLLKQLNQLESFCLSDLRGTIRDVHQLFRNIPHLKWLSVFICHEDTVDIDEYKIWLTEIERHVDLCDLNVEVTNTTKYRWIENELKSLWPMERLYVRVWPIRT